MKATLTDTEDLLDDIKLSKSGAPIVPAHVSDGSPRD